jgi:[ribosomal protein S5]-alanine N-acetyltransferase
MRRPACLRLDAERACSGTIVFMMSSASPTEVAPSRLVRVEDAQALTGLVTRNREFMAPWTRIRPEEFFTVEGQRTDIEAALSRHAEGTALPHVILDAAQEVAGRITLNGIVRGPFLSCSVGYWVSEDRNGRGLATAALAHIKAVAFGELGLHRLQAETLVHNPASQAVLARHGFERFGLAPAYLNIAGRWQEHIMFQVLNPNMFQG